MRVLVVEDDLGIAEVLKEGLEQEGYSVEVAWDGDEGLEKSLSGEYAVIILDIMLPGQDGLQVLEELRGEGKMTPVLVLTAKEAVADKVAGLDLGADDYVTKPFSLEELLARVRALIRRAEPDGTGILGVGDLVLDISRREVTRGGALVELTNREFEVLRCLMERPGRVVSREYLLREVWGYDFDPETNIVDVYISYLRSKIDEGRNRPLIHTVRGIGYKVKE